MLGLTNLHIARIPYYLDRDTTMEIAKSVIEVNTRLKVSVYLASLAQQLRHRGQTFASFVQAGPTSILQNVFAARGLIR